ncbi:MAG TPA: hypothetical protein VHD84_03270 [Candidatus Saccharimonadales bacterium]|nr:hypothetical protein [Candidatus Saccharimonadales bacterium]
MSHEDAPDIPDTADELLAKIKGAKAEKAPAEVARELRDLVLTMVSKSPLRQDEYGDYYREAPYEFPDGREANLGTYLNGYTGSVDGSVEIIDHIGEGQAIRKKYFVNRSEITVNVGSREDKSDGPAAPEAEAESASERRSKGLQLESQMGTSIVSREEAEGLMEDLKTATPVEPPPS